ncbi:MAG: glycosyltransferase [archaeon]|nr:glycosyltransferase [archaeon]
MAKELTASIIIPTFNAEKTIDQCLEALLNQSVKPLEIIVMNDGSTDNTQKIVEEFKQAKLVNQKNSGPAVERNKGARLAKGDIIIFIDSDCIADKDFVKFMLEPFQNKEICGVQGSYKIKQQELIARYTQIVIEMSYAKMAKQKFIDHIGSYAAGYRRKDFLELNGFDESFPKASGEDTEFSYRMTEAGKKLVFNPKAFVYHFHPTSLMRHLKVKFMRGFFRVNVFKKHATKMGKDSFIPITVKILTGLAGLFVASLLVSIFFLPFLWVALALLIAMLITGIFVSLKYFWKKDKQVALAAPFIEILTAYAMGFGFAYGLFRSVFK